MWMVWMVYGGQRRKMWRAALHAHRVRYMVCIIYMVYYTGGVFTLPLSTVFSVHALTLLLLLLLLLSFQAPINPFLLMPVGLLRRTLVKRRQAQSRGGATEEGKRGRGEGEGGTERERGKRRRARAVYEQKQPINTYNQPISTYNKTY